MTKPGMQQLKAMQLRMRAKLRGRGASRQHDDTFLQRLRTTPADVLLDRFGATSPIWGLIDICLASPARRPGSRIHPPRPRRPEVTRTTG
jgi:hypothetical protein